MAHTFQWLEITFTLQYNQWLDYDNTQLDESQPTTNKKDDNLSKSDYTTNSKNTLRHSQLQNLRKSSTSISKNM